jgi:hypothetical protein
VSLLCAFQEATLTPNQLIVAFTKSADDHDEGTGEDNGDIVVVLRRALEHLEAVNQLPQFLEALSQTDLAEIFEFEWLRPAISYVKVKNSAETLQLFTECRSREFILAAAAIQNSGNVPLADLERGLHSITAPDLAVRYNRYIMSNLFSGKDADA